MVQWQRARVKGVVCMGRGSVYCIESLSAMSDSISLAQRHHRPRRPPRPSSPTTTTASTPAAAAARPLRSLYYTLRMNH